MEISLDVTWYAVHPTLNRGNMFRIPGLILLPANILDDFETWWLQQLIKHKQPVTFYSIRNPCSRADAEFTLSGIQPMLHDNCRCVVEYEYPKGLIVNPFHTYGSC
jgi:hypothetical protein